MAGDCEEVEIEASMVAIVELKLMVVVLEVEGMLEAELDLSSLTIVPIATFVLVLFTL